MHLAGRNPLGSLWFIVGEKQAATAFRLQHITIDHCIPQTKPLALGQHFVKQTAAYR